jgi:hypothetical protein
MRGALEWNTPRLARMAGMRMVARSSLRQGVVVSCYDNVLFFSILRNKRSIKLAGIVTKAFRIAISKRVFLP